MVSIPRKTHLRLHVIAWTPKLRVLRGDHPRLGKHHGVFHRSFVVDGVTISNFVKNSDGYYFASSIYSSDPGSGQATANAISPEPASYLLFGSGLLGLGAIFRKKLASAGAA